MKIDIVEGQETLGEILRQVAASQAAPIDDSSTYRISRIAGPGYAMGLAIEATGRGADPPSGDGVAEILEAMRLLAVAAVVIIEGKKQEGRQ